MIEKQTIQQNLTAITHRLIKEFDPKKIILFGSYAWGTPNKDSDLDIFIIVPESKEKPFRRAVRAHRCLRGIRLPMDVMVRTEAEFNKYREVKASLHHKIAEKGKILYER